MKKTKQVPSMSCFSSITSIYLFIKFKATLIQTKDFPLQMYKLTPLFTKYEKADFNFHP